MMGSRGCLVEVAERMLTARDPVLLMIMPGCEPVCVNRQHVDQFPNTDKFLAETIDQFNTRVDDALRKLHERETAGRTIVYSIEIAKFADSLPTCLCEELQAILALDEDDCVFESMYSRSQSTGFEFHLTSQNGKREYTISTALGRRLEGVEGVNENILRDHGKGLFEARLLRLENLTLVAEDEICPTGRALRFDVRLRDSSETYVESRLETIPAQPLGPYTRMSQILDEAIGILEKSTDDIVQARELVWNAVRAINGCNPPRYPTLNTVFLNLFRKPQVEIPEALKAIRQRLWDAPLVGRSVRRIIEQKVKSPDFLLDTARRAFSVQKDLIRLVATLPFQESADRFLGAIEWPST